MIAPGHWIGATEALGRPQPATDPYPHICRLTVAAAHTVSGRPVRLTPRDCAACAEQHPKEPT